MAFVAALGWFVCTLPSPSGDSTAQRLADGTVIALSGLQIGGTNTFTHGTWLSKSIGRLAPAKSISVAGFKLVRPTQIFHRASLAAMDLSLEFRLMPGSPRESLYLAIPFYRKRRLLISGDSDFEFVWAFEGFKKDADGLFCYVHATTFPRDSQQLHFRLEERDEKGEWLELAKFARRIPSPPQ